MRTYKCLNIENIKNGWKIICPKWKRYYLDYY